MSNAIEPFDPYDSKYQNNRYEYYQYYRESDPIHYGIANQPPVFDKWWYLFRYSDIVIGLKDDRLVRELDKVLPKPLCPHADESTRALTDMTSKWILFRDPPEHSRLRSVMNKVFTGKVINPLKSHIADIADELLNKVATSNRMDLIADYAYPLPVIVIAELLGVRSEDRDLFKDWSRKLAAVIDFPTHEQMLEANQVTTLLSDYMLDIIQQRRKKSKEDLISALLQYEGEEGKLSEEELLRAKFRKQRGINITWAHHIYTYTIFSISCCQRLC